MTIHRHLLCAGLLCCTGFDAACAAEPATPLPWTTAARGMAETRVQLAADAAPSSRDALFGDDEKAPATPPGKRESRDALFGDQAAAPASPSWHGFVRGELAYTYADPTHWSKMLVRSELDSQGTLAPGVKYKIGARLDYDFVYDATNFCPSDVRREQRVNV